MKPIQRVTAAFFCIFLSMIGSIHAQIDSARLPMKSLVVGNRWIYRTYQYYASNGITDYANVVEFVAKDTTINRLRYGVIHSTYNNSVRYERSTDTAIFEWKNNQEILVQRWGIKTGDDIAFQQWLFFPTIGFSRSNTLGFSSRNQVITTIGTLRLEGYHEVTYPVAFGGNYSTSLKARYTKNLGIVEASLFHQNSNFRNTRRIGATLIGSIIEGKAQGELDFSLVLSSANITAKSNDTVKIPITISGMKQRATIDTSAFAASLSFNASLLEPLDNTPKGSVQNGIRTIPVSLPYVAGSDSSQIILFFRAAIGNDTITALTVKAEPIGIQYTTTLNNGSFRILGNNAGGSQIKFFSKPTVLAQLAVSPNPASDILTYNVTLSNASSVHYFLINSLGKIATEATSFLCKGNNVMSIETKNLSSGLYLLVVQTNGEVLTKNVQIIN